MSEKSERIVFFAGGEPRGKARPRHGGGRVYTPAATMASEQAIAWEARYAMGPRKPLLGPLSLFVRACWPWPASWSARQRQRSGGWKTSRPDADNVLKLVKDALNGVAWVDDAQVVEARISKRYCGEAEPPGLQIEIDRVYEAGVER